MRNKNHIAAFEHSLEQGNHWLGELEERLQLNNREEAYSVLRAVLHTLRDRLPLDSAVAFAAQLPLILKGTYYDGWLPAGKPLKMHEEAFLDSIEKHITIGLTLDIHDATIEVFRLLAENLSHGTVDKVSHLLPKRLREDLFAPALR